VIQILKVVIVIFFSSFFISCQNEIGRVDLLKQNPSTIQLDLTKHRQIDIWTNIDIEFEEEPLFVYAFDFIKGNEIILQGGVDPLVVTKIKNEKRTDTSWSFYGKLDGDFIPQEDTIYQIKTTFVDNNSEGLKIKKLEVVFLE